MPFTVFTFWVLRFTFHIVLHDRNVLISFFSPSQCLHVVSFIQFLSFDPSSKEHLNSLFCHCYRYKVYMLWECTNTNFFLFHPHNVYMLLALFSFWVLRFTFHMILHHRNIQILFSVTAVTTKFTYWAVFSFVVLRLYIFIWFFIKGTFEFLYISILSSQSLHAVGVNRP